ncbi:MAG: ABC transporter ATP-binding protein [Bacteroidales bacterium]|nr:ABC transporter ATP-binding protein [Bacteroidales bacterium]
MSQPVIRFENVGKLYRLGTVGTGTLAHDLRRWWITNIMHKEDPYLQIGETNDRSTKGHSDYVYALKDINLEVQEGDVLGIIGKNGAGKSTLLKLLSRVTAPTTGKIYTKGRIASLLEVGTGFHPELTGRENIYMNGSILGMKKHEIDRKLDEIIDFSGCERYIDTPVKRYSSGMMVRLGFAVAAHLDPEILVVDEVLAVGDAEFQKKAIGKMQDVSKGEGRTVLFVSHNMGSVRALCPKGILLDNGSISFEGEISNVINLYIDSTTSINLVKKKIIQENNRIISRYLHEVEFVSFEFNKDKPIYASDEDIELLITIRANESKKNCRINCTLMNSTGVPIGSCTSFDTFDIKMGTEKKIKYIIYNPNLVEGTYNTSFSIGYGNATNNEYNFDVVTNAVSFSIDKLFKNSNEHKYNKWDLSWGQIFIKTRTEILESND